MRQISWIFMLLMIVACTPNKKMVVKVENQSSLNRENEMIEVSYDVLTARFGHQLDKSLIVVDEENKPLPYQFVYEGNNIPVKLIFLANVPSMKSTIYTIKEGTPDSMKTMVYGRLVPERKDDICWENDRIAFRAYGPALQATGEISNAYDIWVKRTEDMVIDLRYKMELVDHISYHKDNGNGMDGYKAGRTLGAGAMAPYFKDTIWLANNFITCDVLDNGPLRFSCRLTYAPFLVDSNWVEETRILSLDAGSQLNKVTVYYKNLPSEALVAAGIVKHEGSNEYEIVEKEGSVIYADPIVNPEEGQTFIAVVFPNELYSAKDTCGHILAIAKNKEEGNTYYFGAGWTKWGFPESSNWTDYVMRFSKIIKDPLLVTTE